MNALITGLEAFAAPAEGLLWAAALVFLRVGAVVALLPGFGEQMIPARVRLVLACALTLVVLPGVAERLPSSPPDGFVPMMAEAIAGLVLGIGLRLCVVALQIAGTIAAQATSLSQLFGGAGPEPQPALANLLLLAGVTLAVVSGLPVQVVKALLQSYDIWPPGQVPPVSDVAAWGLSAVAHAFAAGFSLAAPFLIASLLYNVALGVINRAMPQLMVAFVGAPALTLGALVLLAVVAPVALALWLQGWHMQLAVPFARPR